MLLALEPLGAAGLKTLLLHISNLLARCGLPALRPAVDLHFSGAADEHPWDGERGHRPWIGARGTGGGKAFRIPDLAVGDDRHLAPYVRCVRWSAHVGLPGDFDEAGQQPVGPPDQVHVAALGPGDDGRIRVHVREQQNGHEVAGLCQGL